MFALLSSPDLRLELRDPGRVARGRPWVSTRVDLSLFTPAAERVGVHPDTRSDQDHHRYFSEYSMKLLFVEPEEVAIPELTAA